MNILKPLVWLTAASAGAQAALAPAQAPQAAVPAAQPPYVYIPPSVPMTAPGVAPAPAYGMPRPTLPPLPTRAPVPVPAPSAPLPPHACFDVTAFEDACLFTVCADEALATDTGQLESGLTQVTISVASQDGSRVRESCQFVLAPTDELSTDECELGDGSMAYLAGVLHA